jgi:hypothetical protein
MPKKTRRAKQKQLNRAAIERQSGFSQPGTSVSAESQLADKPVSEGQIFLDHYQYLIPELRRIGILAGAIIIILLVLSLTLN